MVVKAIINAVGKGAPKPKKFPPGSEFSKQEANTLLEEAQKKLRRLKLMKLNQLIQLS